MMHMGEQLFKRLEVAEAMRAFISHHPGCIEELRLRLEKVEAELAAAQKAVVDGAEKLSRAEEEKEVFWAEADMLKGRRRPWRVKSKGLSGSEGGDGDGISAAGRRDVFFGYRCCMKKNSIMHDIPSLPSDDEDVIPGGLSC
ncbi:hypothetical protein CK203_044078 [Vitis vinifera]|uniref:Uncharacterized protein n=1 Tax=Vitis vinifera TaxID=29760 RepID=A0A438HM04_VITVI|nr:hypothetical protein CK203_044078 [Vitis vinifera]